MSDYVTVTQGMRGYFAVLITHENGYPEPYSTGVDSYDSEEDAVPEAVMWAHEEGVDFQLLGYDSKGQKTP
jgi:hypothetical protein